MPYESTTDYSLERVLELLEMYQHIPLQAANDNNTTEPKSQSNEQPVMQA